MSDLSVESYSTALTTIHLLNLYNQLIDIILWKNHKHSLIVLSSCTITLYLIIIHNYTLFSLVSQLLLLQLILCTVYYNVYQLYNNNNIYMNNHINTDTIHQFVTIQTVQPYMEITVELINAFINSIYNLYTIQSNTRTIQSMLVLLLFSVIGRYMDGMTVLCVIVLYLFTVPKLYITYQDAIDSRLNRCSVQLVKLINLIMLQTDHK